ncbi:MAG: hypothetical protein LBQ81_13110 [Zoogloeaceae bacterium]|nr:hypothetical protein [Zoogloeaceae bacterium]
MELELAPSEEASSKMPNRYVGRYFYPRYGVDIPLSGTLDALVEPKTQYEINAEEGCEYNDCDMFVDFPKAHWKGRLTGAVYQGRRIDDETGKARTFSLRRVARYDPEKTQPGSVQAVTEAISGGVGSGLAYDAIIGMKQAPYEYLKLNGHAVPVGAERGDEKVAYQMWSDPRSVFKYPRLVRHPDAQVLKKINFLLEQRHWQMTLAALGCRATMYENSGPAAGSLGGYDDETIQVTHLTTTLMSLYESGSTFCGGAHPDNHFDPYTFDLIRGEYLDWNRLFKAFVPGEYGWDVDPAMVKVIERALSENDEDETGYSAQLVKEYFSLFFDQPGKLALAISGIGHWGGANLGVQAEVPFSELKSVLKPGARRYLDPDDE